VPSNRDTAEWIVATFVNALFTEGSAVHRLKNNASTSSSMAKS